MVVRKNGRQTIEKKTENWISGSSDGGNLKSNEDSPFVTEKDGNSWSLMKTVLTYI
jgi:hypothetical protein